MPEETSSEGNPSEGTKGPGWVNEHVRDGFDVDGAQSKILPLGMDRRVRLAQAIYDGLGETGRALNVGDRSLYPVIRGIGALIGRERAAEQLIAEREYVMDRMTRINRTRIVSRRRLLGLALFIAWGLFIVGLTTVVMGAAFLGISGVLTGYFGVRSENALGVTAGLFLSFGLAGLVSILIHVYRDTHRQGEV